MELNLNFHMLLAFICHVGSSLASEAGVWGIEQCTDAGFASANLLCSSCKDLTQFGLNALENSCSKCCQDDTGGNIAGKKYAGARLELCG